MPCCKSVPRASWAQTEHTTHTHTHTHARTHTRQHYALLQVISKGLVVKDTQKHTRGGGGGGGGVEGGL